MSRAWGSISWGFRISAVGLRGCDSAVSAIFRLALFLCPFLRGLGVMMKTPLPASSLVTPKTFLQVLKYDVLVVHS